MSVGALTLRDLEYVVAVAEHGHFGRAAEACGVSQPALSSQIKKTEHVLSAVLFERTKRRVFVTPAGQETVARARAILREAHELIELAGRRREPLAGLFRLGVIATLGPYLLPHVLGPLRRRFPRLELNLREGRTADLLHDLKTGSLHAVLVATPVEDPTLEAQPLFREPFVLALPAGHPLARKRSIRAKDLHAEDMVLLEEGHCLRDQALDVCSAPRGVLERRLQATSLETLRHLVASGAGYSLMPALAQVNGKLRKMIHIQRLGSPVPGRTIVLVWRRGFPRPADVAALATLVRETLPRQVVRLPPAKESL